MPDAVIVDTIRTPIGRAFKGSLAQLRPDEMGAYVVDQLLERNPGVDPALVEDLICGCGMPQGLQAFNIGRIIALLDRDRWVLAGATAAVRETAASIARRRLPGLRCVRLGSVWVMICGLKRGWGSAGSGPGLPCPASPVRRRPAWRRC